MSKYKIKRTELYDEIWTISAKGVAKKYNLNYAKLLQECKNNNIPVPPSGYWAKLSFGKETKKEDLPVSKIDTIEIELERIHTKKSRDFVKENTGAEINNSNYFLPLNTLEFLSHEERDNLEKTLMNIKTKKQTKVNNKIELSVLKEVSDAEKARALAIFEVIKEVIIKLNGDVIEDGRVNLRGGYVLLNFKEGKDTVPHKLTKQEALELVKYNDTMKHERWAFRPQIRKNDHIYNGKLSIKVGESSYFRDKKEVKLEELIVDIIVTIYEHAEESRIETETRREVERIREQEREKKLTYQNLLEEEKNKMKELINLANDYELALKLRSYIKAVEKQGDGNESTLNWIKWAYEKADWIDPVVSKEDDYFGKREHEKENSNKDVFMKQSCHRWGY